MCTIYVLGVYVCTFDAARQHVVFINKLFEIEFEIEFEFIFVPNCHGVPRKSCVNKKSYDVATKPRIKILMNISLSVYPRKLTPGNKWYHSIHNS